MKTILCRVALACAIVLCASCVCPSDYTSNTSAYYRRCAPTAYATCNPTYPAYYRTYRYSHAPYVYRYEYRCAPHVYAHRPDYCHRTTSCD